MSKIDWTKPLHVSNRPWLKDVTLFKETDSHNYIVKYTASLGGEYYRVFDCDGRNMEGCGYRIENVPEEPKDHLHLYKCMDGWQVNSIPNEGGQLQTKAFWEARHKYFPINVIVKVPV